MENLSDAAIVTIMGAVATIFTIIGKVISDILNSATKKREMNGHAEKFEAGTEENLRREMSTQNASLTARVDILLASTTSWQDKFYDMQLELGIMKSENVRLTERVSVLEQVRDTLTSRLSEFAAAFEKERAGLLARIDVLTEKITSFNAERLLLEERIRVFEQERNVLLARIVALENQLEILGKVPVTK